MRRRERGGKRQQPAAIGWSAELISSVGGGVKNASVSPITPATHSSMISASPAAAAGWPLCGIQSRPHSNGRTTRSVETAASAAPRHGTRLQHRNEQCYTPSPMLFISDTRKRNGKKRFHPVEGVCSSADRRKPIEPSVRRHGYSASAFFLDQNDTMSTIPVGILGATSMVGQQFIALLANHPWFRVEWLGASQRSEGKAFRDAAAWRLAKPLPDHVANRTSRPPRRAARRSWCSRGSIRRWPVKSRAPSPKPATSSSATRATIGWRRSAAAIPEINADHLALLDGRAPSGWKGRIVTNPNCVGRGASRWRWRRSGSSA